jgi:hypothetical protein
LDDQERPAPRRDTARQQNQQGAIGAGDTWPLGRAGQDDQLLAQQGVLGDQLRLAAQEIGCRAQDK